MRAMRMMMIGVIEANNNVLTVNLKTQVTKVVDEKLEPVKRELSSMNSRIRALEEASTTGSVASRESFDPSYIQIVVCAHGERKQKGMGFSAAKAWWESFSIQLPEDVRRVLADEPKRMGNMLSSLRLNCTGDARSVVMVIRDVQDDKNPRHKINGEIPRITTEREPSDALDYKVLGHV